MAVKTTYAARSYKTLTGKEDRFVRRMLRLTSDPADQPAYVWCIRCPETGLDVRQGTAEIGDVSADIRAAADAQQGKAFSYVEWPQ